MDRLELVKDQLTLNGLSVTAKAVGLPRTIYLSELEDINQVLALAAHPNTMANEADAYLTGNARRGLSSVVAIQFYRKE